MKDKEQQYQLKIKELEDRVPQEDSNAAQNQLVYEKLMPMGKKLKKILWLWLINLTRKVSGLNKTLPKFITIWVIFIFTRVNMKRPRGI